MLEHDIVATAADLSIPEYSAPVLSASFYCWSISCALQEEHLKYQALCHAKLACVCFGVSCRNIGRKMLQSPSLPSNRGCLPLASVPASVVRRGVTKLLLWGNRDPRSIVALQCQERIFSHIRSFWSSICIIVTFVVMRCGLIFAIFIQILINVTQWNRK